MRIYCVSILLIFLTMVSCQREPVFHPDRHIKKVWSVTFPEIGIYSSPRAADLNGDGVKDLIFGTGKLEMQETEIGIIALSGATGDTLWTLPSRDQMFGSANLIDITGDGTMDVIINGRAATLFAIEGATGRIIWEFLPDVTFQEAKEMGLFNFYNPQFIPDQTGDGLPDILVANGGDFTVPPYDPARPAGKLKVISTATGELLAEAVMPDGKEIYMSAVVAKLHPDAVDYTVIFGTGGETIGGKLFAAGLQDVLNGDLSGATVLATGENKGFIAPPLLADIMNDGYLDIAVNSVDGRVLLFSGENFSQLWEVKTENREAYGSLSVGNFMDQNRLDLFTTFSIGVWPDLRDNEQLLLNGQTGEVMQRDTLGVFQTATPVVADINNDGYDDIILSVNVGHEQFDGSYHYQHMLVLYDFYNKNQYPLTALERGANLASTPWIGDLDGNGKMDIVYSVLGDHRDIFAMNGFSMTRIRSTLPLKRDIRWGAYMGSNYDGVYRK